MKNKLIVHKRKIFSCSDIIDYVPQKATLLIRVFDTDTKNNKCPKLKHKEQFEKIINLHFDDVDITQWSSKSEFDSMLEDEALVPFDEQMAKKLLLAVSAFIEACNEQDLSNEIIIHCRFGVSRSPAILIALNSIFKLNYGNLKKRYKQYNRQVASCLISVAEKTLNKKGV